LHLDLHLENHTGQNIACTWKMTKKLIETVLVRKWSTSST